MEKDYTILIEILERNENKPLTTKRLLNILKIAQKEKEDKADKICIDTNWD